MGLVYLPTWMFDFYGKCRQMYHKWMVRVIDSCLKGAWEVCLLVKFCNVHVLVMPTKANRVWNLQNWFASPLNLFLIGKWSWWVIETCRNLATCCCCAWTNLFQTFESVHLAFSNFPWLYIFCSKSFQLMADCWFGLVVWIPGIRLWKGVLCRCTLRIPNHRAPKQQSAITWILSIWLDWRMASNKFTSFPPLPL